MRRTVAAIAAVATIALMCAVMVPGASASAGTPRWLVHVQHYPGGISNGVRAQALPEVARAQAAYSHARLYAAPSSGGTNVQMNTDSNPPLPQNEESVAYSLANPRIAVAGANDYVSGGVVVMRTSDGGQTWKSTRVEPFFGGTRDTCSGGDPGLTYSLRDSAFYLSQLCFFRSEPFSEVQVYKSVDNGKTWTPGLETSVAASNFDYTTGQVDPSIFNDKPFITVDNNPTSSFYGRVYVTFTKFHIMSTGFSDYCPIQLSYTDNIPTFNPSLAVWQHTPVVPDNPGGNGLGPSANQDSQPVVQSDGTLDVSYVIEECNTALDHHMKFQQSTDGGGSFLAKGVRIDKKGEFKDNPDLGDVLPNKNFRAPLAPSLAYSPVTGTLVFAYQNNLDAATSGANISVNVSHDGGMHWSHMQYISTAGAAPAPNDQYFSWVTAAPDGTFYAIWLDNRRDPGNKLIDTFEAVSHDDGATWSNSRISTASWNPDLGFFQCGCFIGDYSGMVVSSAALYPAWTDGRNTAIVKTGIGEADVFTDVETP